MQSKLLLIAVLIIASSSNSTKNERIVGGQVANAGQFPYVAAIYVTKNTNDKYFCGGAIVGSQWVLTAGQCVDKATSFEVHLGSNTLNNTDTTELILVTSNYILHPDYNATTLRNDIGLIKFRLPIQLSDYIKPANLAHVTIPEGSLATALGWGQVDDDTPAPVNNLHHVELSVISNSDCRKFYGDQITDDMLCGIGQSNEGICHGDIGGPLVDLSTSVTFLDGIASFISGNGCSNFHPSGFTRLSSYYTWITTIMAES